MADYDDSDLDARRESIIDIVASWDLDGARPNEAGMPVVRDYVRGVIDLDETILRMKELPFD